MVESFRLISGAPKSGKSFVKLAEMNLAYNLVVAKSKYIAKLKVDMKKVDKDSVKL